jgi:tetrahydromethanopterin S-methyltransferase subunit E
MNLQHQDVMWRRATNPITALAFGLIQCIKSFRKIFIQFFLGYSKAVEYIEKLVITEHAIGHDARIFRVQRNRKADVFNEMG